MGLIEENKASQGALCFFLDRALILFPHGVVDGPGNDNIVDAGQRLTC